MQFFITDQIRWHDVLLLIINNNHNKICDSAFLKLKHSIFQQFFLLEVKIKIFQVHANNVMAYCPTTVLGITRTVLFYCPISALKSGQLKAHQISEFFIVTVLIETKLLQAGSTQHQHYTYSCLN